MWFASYPADIIRPACLVTRTKRLSPLPTPRHAKVPTLHSVVPPLIAPIARRSVWASSREEEAPAQTPELGFIEPMLRRRLSSLARIVLHVAHACASDVINARVVFASRHGELARTTKMLESLATGEELSPTLFSMSVLNASTGLFSILQKNTAPSTAISAGNASFGYGLLEACLQLVERPDQPVLYLYADEPAPAEYEAGEPPDQPTLVLGLLLDSSAPTRVACSSLATGAAPSNEVQARAFIRALDEGEATWNGGGKTWRWKINA